MSGMRRVRLFVSGGVVLLLGAVGSSGSTQTAGLVPVETTDSPYEGTVAENFAEGADGIVLPPVEVVPDGYIADYSLATRDITTKEVAEALDDVRTALIAARLDRRMLVDHDPQPFIQTLARLYWHAWFDPFLPELRESDDYDQPEFAYLATKLAPGVRQAAEPRVAGRIAYGAGTSHRGGAPEADPWRVLRIATRFVWVYALEVPGESASIVVIRNDVVWQVPTDWRLDCCQTNVGLHHAVAEVRAWGVDCEIYEKQGLVQPDSTHELAVEAFDVDQPLDPLSGCQPERDCSLPVVAPSCAVVGE
jgi:hypothetical protein